LTAGGVISLVIGSLILFSRSPEVELDKRLIVGVTIGVTVFAVLAVGAIIRGQRRRTTTGMEGMVGEIAIAKTYLDPVGKVLAQGELWTAVSDGETIAPGEEVIVTGVDKLKLKVTKKRPHK
jgi:membrane-bound serine protease (ClpP class)